MALRPTHASGKENCDVVDRRVLVNGGGPFRDWANLQPLH